MTNQPRAEFWPYLSARITDVCRVSDDGSPYGELAPDLKGIEEGLGIRREEYLDSDYSPYRFEECLDRANELLNRALVSRATYQELASRWFALMIEANQYVQLDEIHQQEIDGGLFGVESAVSEQQRMAREGGWSKLYKASGEIKGKGDGVSDEIVAQLVRDDMALGYLQGSMRAPWRQLYEIDSITFNVDWNGRSSYSGPVRKTLEAIMARRSMHERRISNSQLRARALELGASREQAWHMKKSAEIRAGWEMKNSKFREDRASVAKNWQDLRARGIVEDGGVLNVQGQLASLRTQFRVDLVAAMRAANAAHTGLRTILGWDPCSEGKGGGVMRAVFDCSGPAQPITEGPILDDLLRWTRQAINWFGEFSHGDIARSAEVSIRHVVGESDWKRGLSGGVGDWGFAIRDELFLGAKSVRLRGVSLGYVAANHGRAWVSGVVTLPQERGLLRGGKEGRVMRPAVHLARLPRPTDDAFQAIHASRQVHNQFDISGSEGSGDAPWKVRVESCDGRSLKLQELVLKLHYVCREGGGGYGRA